MKERFIDLAVKVAGLARPALLILTLSTAAAQPIPGRYIAVLGNDVANPPAAAQALAARHGVQVGHVYQHAIRGFAFAGAPQAAAALARQGEVLWVEQEQIYTAGAETAPTGIRRANVPSSHWDGSGSAVDVDIAIIDTGIQNHPDLNVAGGIRYYTQGLTLKSDNKYSDGNGHGTHVAGTAAARNQGSGVAGVAPGARLWAVKVLGDNGSGSTAAVIAGVDWVAANAGTIEVANMSLGGGFSQAINNAVANCVSKGVVMVVAAGNEAANVSTKSPASEPSAITVSALADSDGLPGGSGPGTNYGPDDSLATFSNFGAGVDICAPGVGIYSTYLNGGFATLSGTSMASPHVAGAAALYVAQNGLVKNALGVEAVATALKNAGWKQGDAGYMTGAGADGFFEPLLRVSPETTPPPPVNRDPVIGTVSISPNPAVTGGVVSFSATASDPDGDTLTYSWNCGDGNTKAGPNTSHTYGSAGSFTVTLTVSDGKGGIATSSTQLQVNNPPPGGITLTAVGYKVKGQQKADLTWSGAASATVQIIRNGVSIGSTANDGFHTDPINSVGGGTYRYIIRDGGIDSNEAIVTF